MKVGTSGQKIGLVSGSMAFCKLKLSSRGIEQSRNSLKNLVVLEFHGRAEDGGFAIGVNSSFLHYVRGG